jgi:LmbE family N-acetylglucosaminyl deacetylase
MRSIAFRALAALLLAFAIFHFPLSAPAQVRPVYDRGATGLGQMLKRLQTTASAMHIAAHPDDEDSGLMAYLARGLQARTAYLSLTRGDGGQNVIGDELSEALGVIRTEELLQARTLDGGEQFFTRAMDYGFSKSREEAARMWGEREILEDMVRAIRLYRPMVVTSRFSGTAADGHGHHQFSGYMAPLAFRAAGDPAQFPAHLREGLEPWQPLKFYVGRGFGASGDDRMLEINTGTYDPLLGRTYFEIAMEGRSQHKSQEMGVLELRGPQTTGLRLVESGPPAARETGIFDGIDTSITGIAALTNNDQPIFRKHLEELEATAAEALRSYDPFHPEKLIPILARGYKIAYDAEWSTRIRASKAEMRQKQDEFAKALVMAAGVVVDALSDRESVNPGSAASVTVKVFAPEDTPVVVKNTQIQGPKEWKIATAPAPAAPPAAGARARGESSLSTSQFTAAVPADARPTQPYWLERDRIGANFDWAAAGTDRTLPFSDALLTASVELEIGGQAITIRQPVEYRFAHDTRGEVRRPLVVMPAATVGLGSDLLIVPVSGGVKTHRIVTTVTNRTGGPMEGSASLIVPEGWTVTPASAPVKLESPGDSFAFAFEVAVPADVRPGTYSISAVADAGGRRHNLRVQEIAYPHIQTHRIYRPAAVTTHVLDLEVAPVKVGYIMGSGDSVPEAIRRLGLEVTMLSAGDLATGDLNAFDTIVVGVRASQTRPDLVANNGRLLEYVREGGTLIVQYQQHEYTRLGLPPYPASSTGAVAGVRVSNSRVTDETAPVSVLVPDHPIFNFPNKITDADWDGWVQERNLYGFTTWDDRYTPLLESHDEGEAENKGGMLYAKVGKGHYVYTAYSWFRQLPAGTPGAYRIFANILSLPKAEAAK